MITKKQEYILWGAFLIIYFLVILSHAIFELREGSLWHVGLALLGATISGASHHYRTSFSIVFLVSHMGIEAVEYALHSEQYIFFGVILIVLFHIVMDYTFLWKEIGHHYPKYQMALFISIVALLLSVFITVYSGAHHVHQEHSHGSWLGALTHGGVLGCIISHFLFDIVQKKHSH